MPAFHPPFCPYRCGPRGDTEHFQFQRKGTFHRLVDGRDVPRFVCKGCRRTFSMQTFRVDYRLKRPALLQEAFLGFVSKTTMRHHALTRGCNRKTLARHLVRLGEHCRRYQELRLRRSGSLKTSSSFQLDELETFEHDRRRKPLTVPVLIEGASLFIVHTEVGAMASRGPRGGQGSRKAPELPRRRSESNQVVGRCLESLARLCAPGAAVRVCTDHKPSYGSILRRRFGERVEHKRTLARVPRTPANPLFAINHTLAMLRDGLSRLVRRTWATTKKAASLRRHLWIYSVWRNFVRQRVNRRMRTTPAMVLGLAERRLRVRELIRWRVFDDLRTV